MISKQGVAFFLLAMGVFFAPSLKADEIMLTDGKSLSGTITLEEPQQVTLNLGPNMYLKVDRTKIKKIIRSVSEGKKRKIITMDSMKKAEPKKDAGVVVATSPVKNISERKLEKITKGRNVTLNATSVRLVYSVRGDDMDDVSDDIYAQDGKGFGSSFKREAYRTSLAATFDGVMKEEKGEAYWESLVVRSTSTSIFPQWNAPKVVDSKDVKKWEEFLDSLEKLDEGIVRINMEGMSQIAESIVSLRENTKVDLKFKSQDLFDKALARTDRRRRGFLRRTQPTNSLAHVKK